MLKNENESKITAVTKNLKDMFSLTHWNSR